MNACLQLVQGKKQTTLRLVKYFVLSQFQKTACAVAFFSLLSNQYENCVFVYVCVCVCVCVATHLLEG